MKKTIFACAVIMTSLTSCYHMTHVVGTGAAGTTEEKKKSSFFVEGLIPGKQADTKAMAGGATNYKIETKMSFVDLLISGITFGIYTPITVKVTH